MAEQVYTFNLPDIGEGVVEGEVIEWLKKVGDPVKKDEPVVIVMTDKATVELPAPYPGTITKHYFKPGEIAFKDKPLYDITLSDGASLNIPKEEPSPKKEAKLSKEVPKEVEPSKGDKPTTSKALAIPKVRHLANELEIDLEAISPTGKHGEVTLHDLHQAHSKISTVPVIPLQGDEEQPLIGVRGLMARKMDDLHLPQFSYFDQVEVTRLIQLREHSKEQASHEGFHLSYMPFFIRALAMTAHEFPQVNSSIDMDRNMLVLHKQMNVGIAMATPLGLIVPVLKNAQAMKLKELVEAYEALKNKAYANKLSSGDMKEATIALSNFGAVGEGLWATPMVTPPAVTILAVGRIFKAPVVKNDATVIRDMLTLSWSFDHRVIDGELAAKISHHYCTLLRDPLPLL